MGRIGNRPYWVLSLSIVIRAMHLVGAAVVLTPFLLGESARPPSLYVVIAVVSGLVLLLTEWIRHRQICRELAGVSTFVKLLLLGAAYHGFLPARDGAAGFLIGFGGFSCPETSPAQTSFLTKQPKNFDEHLFNQDIAA